MVGVHLLFTEFGRRRRHVAVDGESRGEESGGGEGGAGSGLAAEGGGGERKLLLGEAVRGPLLGREEEGGRTEHLSSDPLLPERPERC